MSSFVKIVIANIVAALIIGAAVYGYFLYKKPSLPDEPRVLKEMDRHLDQGVKSVKEKFQEQPDLPEPPAPPAPPKKSEGVQPGFPPPPSF